MISVKKNSIYQSENNLRQLKPDLSGKQVTKAVTNYANSMYTKDESLIVKGGVLHHLLQNIFLRKMENFQNDTLILQPIFVEVNLLYSPSIIMDFTTGGTS